MGLNKIRDFVGVVKDISENYFIEEYRQLEFKSRFRFTDSGVFFSTLSFSKDAEMYAYAQGIYLVPCPQILPFIDYIYNRMIQDRQFKNDFNVFIRKLNEGEFVNISDLRLQTDTNRFSYFGMVMGWYPILISSRAEMPLDSFRDTDQLNVRIGYRYLETEEQNRILTNFEVRFNGWVGEFQIPHYVFTEYLKSMNFLEDMANMKERSINYIDIPLIIERLRRIIRLNLDREWLNEFRQNIKTNQRRENE